MQSETKEPLNESYNQQEMLTNIDLENQSIDKPTIEAKQLEDRPSTAVTHVFNTHNPSIIIIDGIPYHKEQLPPYYRQQTIYVMDRDNIPNNHDATDPFLSCAILGFCFSWIPIIGIITYLFNFDADSNSLRAKYSKSACCIATFVILFNLFFWCIFELA